MALAIFDEVSDERRAEIKKRIDTFGRLKFAEKIGESYHTLSNRLNDGGTNRLTVCVADHFEQVLEELGA